MDDAAGLERLQIRRGALLDFVRLPHLPRVGDVDGRYVDAAADALRARKGLQSADHRDDLDIRRGWEAVHLPVSADRYRLRLRLLHWEGCHQGGPVPDDCGVDPAVLPGAVLLAA